MAARPSLSAMAFAKALRSLETGGLSHTGVMAEMKELLEAGASPTELRDTLLNRELIEPLSVQARAEILGLLNGAMLRERQRAAAAGENPNTPQEVPLESQDSPANLADSSSAVTALQASLAAARDVLESERKTSREAARGAAKAAADGLLALETARARADQATADADHFRAEAQSLHDTLDERDATLTQMRQSLSKREAQLAGLSKEHTELSSALESRSKGATLLQGELQAARAHGSAIAADLTKAAAALELEKNRAQANSKSMVEKLVSTEAALARAEAALKDSASHQTEAQTVRDTLTAREADVLALQREQGNHVMALQSHEKKRALLESELQAARARADEAASSSTRFQMEAQALRETLETHEAALAALQREQGEQTAEVTTADDQNTQLEADLKAARSRAEEALADSTRYQAEARTLLNTVATHAADRAGFQREYDKQVTALEAQQRHGTQLEAELQKLRAHAAALEEKLNSRQEVTRALDIRADQATPSPQVLKFPPISPTAQNASGKTTSASGAKVTATARDDSSPTTTRPWSLPVSPRVFAIAVVLIVAAVLIWELSHRASQPVGANAPASAAEVPNPGTTFRDCPTCPTMTVLPAGRFKQGSPVGSSGAPSFEQPQHWVVIGKPFAMSTTPITVDDFAKFVAASGREVQGCDVYDGSWKHRTDKNWKDPGFSQTGTHPVTCVSSNDAAAYAGWLSTQTGHKYRLPSASEWEYAARAGNEAVQPWGAVSTDACRYANVADQSATDQYPGWQIFACDDAYVNTAPVGTYEANAFGLKDMLGNVFQWTEDCWNADYTGAPVDGSARSDGDCGQRELRGGSWFSSPDFVRANYRNHFAADYRATTIGIRIVRDLGP